MLSQLERRVLRCYSVPAANISVAERISIARVMAIKRDLRERGIAPHAPELDEPVDGGEQLSFDALMRSNRGLRPTGAEPSR